MCDESVSANAAARSSVWSDANVFIRRALRITAPLMESSAAASAISSAACACVRALARVCERERNLECVGVDSFPSSIL